MSQSQEQVVKNISVTERTIQTVLVVIIGTAIIWGASTLQGMEVSIGRMEVRVDELRKQVHEIKGITQKDFQDLERRVRRLENGSGRDR